MIACSFPFESLVIEGLLTSARRAGAAILDIYGSDFAVEQKADSSPVTAADQAAEALILEDLARLTPKIPVVAEESVAAGHIPEVGTAPFWLVDPLDGTKEFVKRNGEFTVNIGLVIDRYPVFGVVYAPVLDTLYFGGNGCGCFRERAGMREPIAARVPSAEGLVVLSSRSHVSPEQQAYLRNMPIKRTIDAGSSLKFCRLAEGEGDLYPRFGPTCEWDTCAGHAVLAAAGGSVTQPDGAPFLYAKPGFHNGFFIATGRREG